jgi:hypothetical protein
VTDVMIPTTNKWAARIEERRKENRYSHHVEGYVMGLVTANHVSLDELKPWLTPDEIAYIEEQARLKAEADARAKAESEERRRIEAQEEEARQHVIAAFYAANPPSPLAAVAQIETENELLDILARYHIAKVECSFQIHYYNWDENYDVEDVSICKASLVGSDIRMELEYLPGDDDGNMYDAIYDAIVEMAHARAEQAARECHGLMCHDDDENEGTVIFDVQARRIIVDAPVEVTRNESVEISWEADEDRDD